MMEGVTVDAIERRTLTVPEAAEVLGVSRNSAYAAARSGDLPTIRIGRRLLVPVDALERKLTEVSEAGAPV
jgi:excisionase family DNA binding protein